jgi:hypothetical protein
MDEMNELSPYLRTEHIWPNPAFANASADSQVQIADERVARLLIVLHDIDTSVPDFDEMPESDLSELVSSAILACGFSDPIEASQVIAAILEMVEMPEPATESS